MDKRLVVFDQAVAINSPAGSCVLAELDGLAPTTLVTIFSARCDLAGKAGIEWCHVPLPQKPLLARYVIFQLLAPILFVIWRLNNWRSAIRIQTTQGQFAWADVAYAHFCHRAYLKGPWKQSSVSGVKRFARFLNHSFNAYTERSAFRRARKIVVPSEGLARELAQTYPDCSDKVEVLANPVDLQRFTKAPNHDNRALRAELGFRDDEIVCVFVALGDFARKGLGLTIEAMGQMVESERLAIRILVVGGNAGEIEEFSALAKANAVDSRVTFVGLQKDVCSFLWASDALVFPSAYEIFSLAILQAAAAGLPALVPTGLYGAEEFIVDGVNGWVVERSVDGVKGGLQRLLASRSRLVEMSMAARTSVERYSRENFVARWRTLYGHIE